MEMLTPRRLSVATVCKNLLLSPTKMVTTRMATTKTATIATAIEMEKAKQTAPGTLLVTLIPVTLQIVEIPLVAVITPLPLTTQPPMIKS